MTTTRCAWSAPVSNSEAYRRAGGRRRYNAMRRAAALVRSLEALALHRAGCSKADIASRLLVSRSTVQCYFRRWTGPRQRLCPVCRRVWSHGPEPLAASPVACDLDHGQPDGGPAARIELVVQLLQAGHTQAEVARRLGVSPATTCRDVRRLWNELIETGCCPVCGAAIGGAAERAR